MYKYFVFMMLAITVQAADVAVTVDTTDRDVTQELHLSNVNNEFTGNGSGMSGILLPADIDTFAELDAIVADETLLKWVTAPATATSAGTAGQIAYDANYFYVCVSTDVWRRTVMASW